MKNSSATRNVDRRYVLRTVLKSGAVILAGTAMTQCGTPGSVGSLGTLTGPTQTPVEDPPLMKDSSLGTTHRILLEPDGVAHISAATGATVPMEELSQGPGYLEDGAELNLGFEFSVPGDETVRGFSRQFPGFFVYVDRVETHPLQPCVAQPVKHFHVVVKRYSNTPDTQAWTKLHLGKYESGGRSCYVLYDSLHKWLCLPTCGRPTQKDLQRFFQDAFKATLLAAGVIITAVAIASAAEVLAVACLGLMLAL